MQRDLLRQRLGTEPDDTLLDALLTDARTFILCYTARTEMPQALEPIELQLATIAYRRLGAEGETSHAEGGVTMAFDVELASIREQLKRYRQGYVGMEREVSAQ